MNITREVYDDLLVLREAGTASDATRKLIAECEASHPEWRASSPVAVPLALPDATPSDRLERRALERTQRLLAMRNWLLGVAFFLSFSTMTFHFGDGRMKFILYRDLPWLAVAMFAGAGLTVCGFLWVSRRLAALGLRARSAFRAGVAWALAAAGLLLPLAVVLSQRSGTREPLGSLAAVALIGFLLGVWSGRVTPPR